MSRGFELLFELLTEMFKQRLNISVRSSNRSSNHRDTILLAFERLPMDVQTVFEHHSEKLK